jgi:uncharacterized membrane protein YdbT with pleckstrin-like domain
MKKSKNKKKSILLFWFDFFNVWFESAVNSKYFGMLVLVFVTALIIEVLRLIRYRYNFKISEQSFEK